MLSIDGGTASEAFDVHFKERGMMLGDLRECQQPFLHASSVLDSGLSSSPSLY